MSGSIFKNLCDDFCNIAKVPPPSLEMDGDGLIAFHLTLRGVTTNVVYAPHTSEGHVFVLIECGQPLHDDPQHMLTLLDVNFFPLQVYPPTFARNPATGEPVLQFVRPLDDATPDELFELINKGIDVALRWRLGSLLDNESVPDSVEGGREPASLFASFA